MSWRPTEVSYTELEVKRGGDSVRLVTPHTALVWFVLLLVGAVVLVPLVGAVRVMLKQKGPEESDGTAKARVVSGAIVLAVVSAVVALLVWLLFRPGTSGAGQAAPDVRYVSVPQVAIGSGNDSASPVAVQREEFVRLREQIQSIETHTRYIADENPYRITIGTMLLAAFAASVAGTLVVITPLLVVWRRRGEVPTKSSLKSSPQEVEQGPRPDTLQEKSPPEDGQNTS